MTNDLSSRALGRRADAVAEVLVEVRCAPIPVRGDLRRDHAGLDALDVGCGTGFLTFELAARSHRVTGVGFAPAMLVEARREAAERSVTARFVGNISTLRRRSPPG